MKDKRSNYEDHRSALRSSSTGERSIWSPVLVCMIIGGFLFPIVGQFIPSALLLVCWSFSQWIPIDSIRIPLQREVWKNWEKHHQERGLTEVSQIPFVDLEQLQQLDLLHYLEITYGKDWRRRPLLIRNLWSKEQLNNQSRHLTLQGLLQNNQTIPYFTDARIVGALTPDDQGRVRDIVTNITNGAPHKIASQWLVQNNPNLIYEVAPIHIVEGLFGNYFHPENVVGWGPGRMLPAFTTVPVFIASSGSTSEKSSSPSISEPSPHTGLHCEPIGNLAVQLSGKKKWTLIQPEFSYRLRPALSPDGRAFFASMLEDYSNIPSYTAVTGPGDAIYVPVWTWHRVDYSVDSTDLLAIGGSLFHFRQIDFFRNHPLFAVLIVPSLVRELIGIKTQ